MDTADAGRAPGFTLGFGRAWCTLAAGIPEAGVAEAIDGWLADTARLRPFREDLVRLLGAAADLAAARDAAACAVLALPDPDSAETLYTGMMLVRLMLSPVRKDGRRTADPHELLAAARDELGMLVGGLVEADMATLGGVLPAVRVRTLTGGADPDATEQPVLDTVRYTIPYPGSDGLAVLEFATPFLAVSDDLVNVLDAVVDTFRWEDQP